MFLNNNIFSILQEQIPPELNPNVFHHPTCPQSIVYGSDFEQSQSYLQEQCFNVITQQNLRKKTNHKQSHQNNQQQLVQPNQIKVILNRLTNFFSSGLRTKFQRMLNV